MRHFRLIAFDLDGTLTQHKSPLSKEYQALLHALSEKYHLLMVGAGSCERIYHQMQDFPIDIIGNYGMQRSEIINGKLTLMENHQAAAPDRPSVERRMTYLREKYGYTDFAGDNVEYHLSGMLTLPLLGTKAKIEDKIAFDPTREKRKVMYPEVKELFSEYTSFIGGSSSFDLVPLPYQKYYALDQYCRAHGYAHDEALFLGDDYHPGGNDEPVYHSDFSFWKVDHFEDFPQIIQPLLAE